MLTALVLLVSSGITLAILLWPGSFAEPSPATRENQVLAEAQGWSAATLFVATPLAIASLWAACRGSLRGRLVWIGTLAYLVYTYLEFAVSPPFTALYLPCIVAFACALPALILGVASIDIPRLPAAFSTRVPRRVVAIFSLLFAGMLAATWLKDIALRTLAGASGWPVGEDAVGHVVRALDLGLQVPLGIAAGILLFRRRAAGLLVAAVVLINGVCMGAALTAMAACSADGAGASVTRAWPFAVVWGLALALSVRFFQPGAEISRRDAFR